MNKYAYWDKDIYMKKSVIKFLNKVMQPNCAIEQDAKEIEWEETESSLATDDLAKFRQELRRGHKDVADSCLRASNDVSKLDSNTEHELLRYGLGKALARSPECRLQYVQQEIARRRRLEK
jgi:hypothetical protein